MHDPDYGKTGFARRMFRLRFWTLGVSQAQFAERFGLSFGSVKDLEQGRAQPARAVTLLLAAIEADPAFMARIARAESGALAERRPSGYRWSAAEPARP